MQKNELPVIVIAQGAVQPIDAYKSLHEALESLGYRVVHPLYPTLYEPDESQRAKKSLYDDAACIRDVVTRLVQDEGRHVFIVCHSYGGLVASESIPEELTQTWRRNHGSASGGVLHMFLMCAAVLRKGESIAGGAVSHQIPSYVTSPDEQLFTLRDSAAIIYNDLAESEAKHWDSMHLWQSVKARSTPATREAYRYTDTTYLITEDDAIAPAEIQEGLATVAGAHIERIKAGHSPWLSCLTRVTEIIDWVVRQSWENLKQQDQQ